MKLESGESRAGPGRAWAGHGQGMGRAGHGFFLLYMYCKTGIFAGVIFSVFREINCSVAQKFR